MGNNLSFYLSGNSWYVIDIDENNKVIHVEKTDKATLPKWSGQPILLTYQLCQEYLGIISSQTEIKNLSENEMEILTEIQSKEVLSQKPQQIVIKKTDRNICLFTFCGNKVNYTIALMLRYYLGFETFEVSAYQIALPVNINIEDILNQIEKFKKNPKYYFSQTFFERISRFFPKIEYSKFQSFLPVDLSNQYLSDLLLDGSTTEKVCSDFEFKTS